MKVIRSYKASITPYFGVKRFSAVGFGL